MNTRFAVVVGLDVGKTAHHACALDPEGNKLFDKPLPRACQFVCVSGVFTGRG